jgi:5-(carboxyamino)imidazole ribonucleotide synthase
VTKRLGIVGGGQLGRMLALAAAPLGIECRFVDPSPEAGARVAAEQLVAAFDDLAALERLAEWSDVVTFEFENVPAAALAAISARATLAPSPRSLEVSQDRLSEKQLFESLGLPVAPYAAVDSSAGLEAALTALGVPAILKTRRLGYDGKGQVRIESQSQAAGAWEEIGGVPAILEGFVEFDREISAIVVRSAGGASVAYPPAENVHRSGILHTSHAPAPGADESLCKRAIDHASAVAEELGHVGTLTVEMFVSGDQLVINELAPRVHNSGHWTLDGAGTSQFENHVRAVAGLPLGAAGPVTETVMVNLVGAMPEPAALLDVSGAHLHDYAKSPRPGRKLGHVNVVALEAGDVTLGGRAGAVAGLADAAWC